MPNFGIGDIVEVKGYGGYAKVINMEIDGYTPQGYPKYLCTLDFGGLQTWVEGRKGKKVRQLHQFYASRCTNILDVDEEPQEQRQRKRSPRLSPEETQRQLREIEIEMMMLRQELS
jgi:hypothetical protein